VILVDANLLIYAHVKNLPQHFAAKGWLDECLNASAPLGLPWPSLLGFLRIVTNPRIFEQPESVKDAWKQIKEWLECPSTWIPRPSERHVEILEDILLEGLLWDIQQFIRPVQPFITLKNAGMDIRCFRQKI